MKRANMFKRYEQPENDLTNGLISLLSLADIGEAQVLPAWLADVGLVPEAAIDSFKVLEGIDGTADAELSGPDCRILIETKIHSRKLEHRQVDAHLNSLRRTKKGQRRLLLLTPDSSEGHFVAQFLNDRDGLALHLSWRRVYELLDELAQRGQGTPLFKELTRQYLECIQTVVLARDWAGVIHKLKFGPETELEQDTYLDWFKNVATFHTKNDSEALDGPGRMLVLYDPLRKAITAHAKTRCIELAKQEDEGFPWAIRLVPGSQETLRTPIPLTAITRVTGLKTFGRGRTAVWKLTRQQLDQLLAEAP